MPGTITVEKTLSYRFSDELPDTVEVSLAFLTKLDPHCGYVDLTTLVLNDDRGYIYYQLSAWDFVTATFTAKLIKDTRING